MKLMLASISAACALALGGCATHQGHPDRVHYYGHYDVKKVEKPMYSHRHHRNVYKVEKYRYFHGPYEHKRVERYRDYYHTRPGYYHYNR